MNRKLAKYLYTNRSLSIIFIVATLFYASLQVNNIIISKENGEHEVVPILGGKNSKSIPSFSLQPFQHPRILFIVSNPTNPSTILDKPFADHLTSILNYEVVYHEDNNSYNYDNFDAIIISGSITEEGTVNSLYNAPIPILTMEHGTYNEFQLGNGGSLTERTSIFILDNTTYITSGLQTDTIEFYNVSGSISHMLDYTKVPSGTQTKGLAQPSESPSHNQERNIIILEKADNDWSLTPAPERRVFWGAAEGSKLNPTGWLYWEKAVKWILYDDVDGNSTITVNVRDLDNKNVFNALVNLTDADNITKTWNENTSASGQVVFTNKSFGYYNITVEYEEVKNDSLTFVEIAGTRTYEINPFLDFTVIIPKYLDGDPPLIQNIHFLNDTRTFFADVIDESSVNVKLNITAINTTTSTTIPGYPDNFTMRIYTENTYYNDTALDLFTGTDTRIYYNIIATDIASNAFITPIETFILEDAIPPIIQDYGATDYGNGTVEYYTEVYDENGIQDPVLIKINSTIYEMHLNSSGYWIFRDLFYYGDTLNYTIYSVLDTVGNENGTNKYPNSLDPSFRLTNPIADTEEPKIWSFSEQSPNETHEEGYVEFSVLIDDHNDYQSGVNSSNVLINLTINGESNNHTMMAIGTITYYFNVTFLYTDIIFYQIIATDLAGNTYAGIIHGPYLIGDNDIPEVSYWAKDWENSTIDFYSNVYDWPNNQTTAFLLYSYDWFGPYTNLTLNNLNETHYFLRVSSIEFQLQDMWYYVVAVDYSKNVFDPSNEGAHNITLTDSVAPDITVSIENSNEYDGQIIVFAFARDKYGLIYDLNNSFRINITIGSNPTEEYEMSYDSFYFYKFIATFCYLDEVTISVWTFDEVGNLGIVTKSIIVDDLTPPNIETINVEEYQNGTVTIWAVIHESENGSGFPDDNSTIILEYIFVILHQEKMKWNGSENIYTFSITGFEPKNTFAFRIIAEDNNNNMNITDWTPVVIIDITPPVCYDYGFIDNPSSSEDSSKTRLTFWVKASDNFGEIEKVNITIYYIFDNNLSKISAQMAYNGSIYVFSTELNCNILFNYTIKISDEAFNEIEVGNTNQITYWGPVIFDTGIIQLVNSYNVLIWANVSHWGSGISTVFVTYNLDDDSQSAGFGSNDIQSIKTMDYNGSLYITRLSFKSNGVLEWQIIANSTDNSYSVPDSMIMNEFMIIPVRTIGISPSMIVFSIFGTALIIGLLVMSLSAFRRRTRKKRKITRKINEKLGVIRDIYTVLVTTNVGIPILNTTNAMYIKDKGVTDLISGISVSIDAFLESFQADFMQEISEEEETKSEQPFVIRSSVIEQQKIQILITASPHFRIFVFFKSKPAKFIRKSFCDAVTDLEKNLSHIDPGIINENVVEPQTRLILQKFFPINLLTPFKIDITRLRKIDSDFKKGLPVPLSKIAITALKRLLVIKTTSEINLKDSSSQIKFFEEVYRRGLYQEEHIMVYNEVIDILTKIFKLSPHYIHEVVWISSTPEVNIIVHSQS